MALTKKQMELDKIKWEISESLGVDMCGSFEFCPLCNKDVENPCDKAYKKFKRKNTVKTVKEKEVALTKTAKAKKSK